MKSGKTTASSEVSVEMTAAKGKTGINVMMDLCQRVYDCRGMPGEWRTSLMVHIFEGKDDAMGCGSYRGLKLLEYAMKIDERVLERRIQTLINSNKMQFEFMPGKGTVDSLLFMRMQEKYQEWGKQLYTCFVCKEKAFDRA